MELTTYLDVTSDIYQDRDVYMLGDENVWKQDDTDDDVDIVGTEATDDDVAA